MKQLLVVDDEFGSRESLKQIFHGEHQVFTADSADAAYQVLGRQHIDLILLDVIMPGTDGITFLEDVLGNYPGLPVVMVSASTSVRRVVEAIQLGAFDYVTKPFDITDIRNIVARALRDSSLQRNVEILQDQIAEEFPVDGIIGRAPVFLRMLSEALQAADTDANVLITGESGTGKELVARLIHTRSNRSAEPFVPLHCGALPEALMESELFGHEKGAFTSADKQKPGRFDLAGSGTIFFDEVGEMTLSTQVKLLRVLEEKEYMRVGGTRVIRTNARILSATNVNLKKAIEAKRFREDLFYRLNVVPIELPPLRERRCDVRPLAVHFLRQFNVGNRYPAVEFTPEAVRLLEYYPWPGNVRELRNVVERMLVLYGRNAAIEAHHLPEEFHDEAPRPSMLSIEESINLADAVSDFERQLVQNALKQANGVQTRAAAILGTTRRILKYRMQKLNITG